MTASAPAPRDLVGDLVIANRVLARLGVVDAYGHVSVRDPRDAGRYLISRSLAPELVEEDDVVVLDLDSAPTGSESRALYSERFIHGELYRARADVVAIVHHHSPTAVAFGVSPTSLRAVYHMAGFLGDGIPNFDIRRAADAVDMLVRTPELGRALAQTVGGAPAALMRGHGAVVVGGSIAQVVGRSLYLEVNARIQADAIQLGATRPLDGDDSRLMMRTPGDYERAWELWKRQTVASRATERKRR